MVGEPRDRDIGQFLGGPCHVQGTADAHTGLIEQLQPLPCRDGELADPRFTHQQQPSVVGADSGFGRLRSDGRWLGQFRFGRCLPGQLKLPRQATVSGRRRGVTLAGRRPRWSVGKAGLDGEPFGTGGGRHRPAHQHRQLTVGQTHLHGSPARGGNQLRRLFSQDLFVPAVHHEIGRGTENDLGGRPNVRFPRNRHNGCAGAAPIPEQRLDEGLLPLRVLFQYPPLDRAGRSAGHGHHFWVGVGAQAGEINDALNTAADRIAYRRTRADVRVQAGGEVLDARDVGGPPLHERGADPVRTDDVFGIAETRGEAHPVEVPVQRGSGCATMQYRSVAVGKNHAHSGPRKADLQPVEDGCGYSDDALIRVQIGPVGRCETVRDEPKGFAASPGAQDRDPDASAGRFVGHEMLVGAVERGVVLNGVRHRVLPFARNQIVATLIVGVMFILVFATGVTA